MQHARAQCLEERVLSRSKHGATAHVHLNLEWMADSEMSGFSPNSIATVQGPRRNRDPQERIEAGLGQAENPAR